MENLVTKIVPLGNLEDEIRFLFVSCFGLPENRPFHQADDLDAGLYHLSSFKASLRNDLFVLIEYPYVDKVYRDSYYHYFSSKNDKYSRDTIRLSFFSEKIKEEDFRSGLRLEFLKNCYQGFLVIRPSFPKIIGRSVLSRKAFKENDFLICPVNYKSSANGVKLQVSGFPHSSQDGETISCAEATLWNIMEYFGNRYPDYTPTLPGIVTSILKKYSSERLIPTAGLTSVQISHALKEFGFGVKSYSGRRYDHGFFEILRIYIESGIPVVACLTNDQGMGHALTIIGRKNPGLEDIDKLPAFEEIGGTKIFDFSQMDIPCVCMDDNLAPYRTFRLHTPASNYSQKEWESFVISHFIIPLYPKIYLEAGEARRMSITFVKKFAKSGLIKSREILMRTFLAPSRSFKNEIAMNETLAPVAKEVLLSTPMPKFIWATEIGNKTLCKEGKASGIIVLDATEPKKIKIIAGLTGSVYLAGNSEERPLIFSPFTGYQNNLK